MNSKNVMVMVTVIDWMDFLHLQAFHEAVEKAVEYKKNPEDIEDQIMEELENMWKLHITIHKLCSLINSISGSRAVGSASCGM